MDRSQDTDMRDCQVCGVVVIGHFSCKECTEACQVRCGHVMPILERVDNNWTIHKCIYCGLLDYSQCKDVIKE